MECDLRRRGKEPCIVFGSRHQGEIKGKRPGVRFQGIDVEYAMACNVYCAVLVIRGFLGAKKSLLRMTEKVHRETRKETQMEFVKF